MGKTYKAMHDGTVMELRVRAGDFVEAGDVIAKTMWTDERGRSLTGGTTVSIKAPVRGTVSLYVMQGGRFQERQPLFHIKEPGDPDL
jgi:pyruvate/2-oxoglutarate dehydrogenase complex dihydrolipoamide acyltransferase (E2) component